MLTGSDQTGAQFRILQIDRTCPGELKMSEDKEIYSASTCKAKIDELGKQLGFAKTWQLCGLLGVRLLLFRVPPFIAS